MTGDRRGAEGEEGAETVENDPLSLGGMREVLWVDETVPAWGRVVGIAWDAWEEDPLEDVELSLKTFFSEVRRSEIIRSVSRRRVGESTCPSQKELSIHFRRVVGDVT